MNIEVEPAPLREVTLEDIDRVNDVLTGGRVISPNDSLELLVALTREVLELRTLVEGIAAMVGWVRPEGVARIQPYDAHDVG